MVAIATARLHGGLEVGGGGVIRRAKPVYEEDLTPDSAEVLRRRSHGLRRSDPDG